MSAESVIIRSLEFTNSVGRHGTNDTAFSDIIEYGGFPREQNIKGITKIEVFSNKGNKDAAVIAGLRVTYKLHDSKTVIVPHGLVNEELIGEFTIDGDQLLVGVFGQIKNRPEHKNDGRLASISFVLFNKKDAKLETLGPYHGSTVGLGKAWASFGDIVAFTGTRNDEAGITSLGFTLDTSR